MFVVFLDLGIWRNDGSTPVVRLVQICGRSKRGTEAVGKCCGVGVLNPGTTTLHNDVLPRLHHHTLWTRLPAVFHKNIDQFQTVTFISFPVFACVHSPLEF